LRKQPGFYLRLAAETFKHHFKINLTRRRNPDLKIMQSLPTRRSFLKHAAWLPLAAAGFPLATASAAIAPIKRTGGSHLKTSLNAYSFLDLLNANLKDASQGVDLFQVCDFCAKVNFDAVDVTGYFFPGYPKAPDDSYIFKLKRHAFDLGLAISGTGVRNDFSLADFARRKQEVQLVKDWIEVAAKLGAPVIRVFSGLENVRVKVPYVRSMRW